jgi:hypothetical protein
MDVRQYIEATGSNAHALSQSARCKYQIILNHLNRGSPIGPAVAKKLEASTGGLIKAAHVLGLDSDETPEALELLARLQQGQQAQQEAQS